MQQLLGDLRFRVEVFTFRVLGLRVSSLAVEDWAVIGLVNGWL